MHRILFFLEDQNQRHIVWTHLGFLNFSYLPTIVGPLEMYKSLICNIAGPTFLQNPGQPAAPEERHRRCGHSCYWGHLWHFQQRPPWKIRGGNQLNCIYFFFNPWQFTQEASCCGVKAFLCAYIFRWSWCRFWWTGFTTWSTVRRGWTGDRTSRSHLLSPSSRSKEENCPPGSASAGGVSSSSPPSPRCWRDTLPTPPRKGFNALGQSNVR